MNSMEMGEWEMGGGGGGGVNFEKKRLIGQFLSKNDHLSLSQIPYCGK